jgi:CHAT domain-containing protein
MRKRVNYFIFLIILIQFLSLPFEVTGQATWHHEEVDLSYPVTKPDEVALIYSITDSSLRIDIGENHEWQSYLTPIDKNFKKILRTYRNKIKQAETQGATVYGTILFQILIQPVLMHLSNKIRLVIFPDSVLSDLPFETLICGFKTTGLPVKRPRFLVEDYEIVYRFSDCLTFQSTSSLENNIHLPLHFNLIGLGDARDSANPAYLTFVSQEFDSLCTLFHTKGMSFDLLQGNTGFSEKQAQNSTHGTIIHFAGHYCPDNFIEQNSGFLFQSLKPFQDRAENHQNFYSAKDIFNLNLRADLIVLNGCQSGYIRMESGMLQNSIPPILIRAGAGNIISTLWSVADHLALKFMVSFYHNLLSGTSYATALRQTKLKMLGSRETSLPHIWAPYILTSGP